MYKRILIPLENTNMDQTILDHIRPLARLNQSALVLLHVADGWVARNYDELVLRESEEMRSDRAYLNLMKQQLETEGFTVSTLLALGDPATQIIKASQEQQADLIAMTTHGHRFLSDLLYGSTADKVRHSVDIPVLFLKARRSLPAKLPENPS